MDKIFLFLKLILILITLLALIVDILTFIDLVSICYISKKY